jgi:hypothetical protein
MSKGALGKLVTQKKNIHKQNYNKIFCQLIGNMNFLIIINNNINNNNDNDKNNRLYL